MSQPSGTWRSADPVSGGPLDEPTVPDDGTETHADDASGERYDLGGLLGRGGMGEVRIARDTRLGRDVALKTARVDSLDAARLAREAAMTARLEHPSIMPVYDAGRGTDGRPYYTMRLLPGRSLAEVLHQAPRGPDRLRLVRHLVDAAEAIAYAHGRGVLHRDLKPANIMVGAFGETVVADWGLACTVEEAARERAGGAGSPGYMSPEQSRGAPLDGRTDVYGLGAVLHEVLVGEPPPPAADGPTPPVRSRFPDTPPALAAIADRALRADPADRYPSARALADDLLAWYEGRRVSAHVYTVRELVARLATAWRVPLVVGGVGLVALAAAVSVGWWRTAREQERAVASEAQAVAARDAEEVALARTLVAQARSAAASDRALEAEVLAVNALLRRPSPEARGVLARFGVSPRVSEVTRGAALPACRDLAISRAGDQLVCLTDTAAAWLDPMRPDTPIAVATGVFTAVAFATDDRVALASEDGRTWEWRPPAAPRLLPDVDLLRARLGIGAIPGRVTVIRGGTDWELDLDAGTLAAHSSCGSMKAPQYATVAPNGDRVVACADMRIVRGAAGGPSRTVYTLDAEHGTPFYVEPLADGGLLLGTVKGWAIALGPDGHVRTRRKFGDDAVRTILVNGDRAALGLVGGGVRVWNFVRDEVLATLHLRAHALAWRPDGLLRMVSDRAEDRRIPDAPVAHRVQLPEGVSTLELSPDGRRVAVGTGDGSVTIVDLAAARVERTFRWQERVTKDIAWSLDGQLLAVATAGGTEQRVIDAITGDVRATLPRHTARRVAWLPKGLLVATYTDDLRWWPEPTGAPAEMIASLQMVEIEQDGAGKVVAMDTTPEIYSVRGGSPPVLRSLGRHPQALCVAPFGADVLVGTEQVLRRLDPEGRTRAEVPVHSAILDIAVSRDRRLVALAHLDGTATIRHWGDDAPLATFEGHTARVTTVAISPDGTRVVTGSWDGTIRIWSTDMLETPASALAHTVESEWGRDLDAVLGGPP